jgi:hypothetical protein
MKNLMTHSGYFDPVVKLLNPSTTEIQYVSDTIGTNIILPASMSYS